MDGDTAMKWELTILNRPVTCTVATLDNGIHILLVGGDEGHIGAVSVCDPDAQPETITMSGHKEQFITVPWSKALADAARQRCCVVCGIHFDNATPAEINTIMTAINQLLQQVLSALSSRKKEAYECG